MNKQSLTVAEVRCGYSDEKRAFDKDYPWLYFVARPISFYPTWLLLKLGITANQATLIGLIISIIGCIFLAFGSYWAAIIGVVLVNIGYLFDVIDGNAVLIFIDKLGGNLSADDFGKYRIRHRLTPVSHQR